MKSKSNIFLPNSLNLLNLSGKKKRILFLTFLIITFLLSSTIANAPGSKAYEIQSKFQPPPDNVELVGMWPYGACNASAVDTTRNIALIGNGYTLQVLDISTPSSLSKIGEVTLDGNAQDIAISGNYAYIVTLSSLKIVDISDLNSPNVVGSEHFEEEAFERGGFQSIAFSSGYVYMAASPHNGLYIYDVSDPNNPTRQAFGSYSSITDVAIWGNYVICEGTFLTSVFPPESCDGIEVIDVSNPLNPSFAGRYKSEAGYGLSGIDVSEDGYVYSCQYSGTDDTGKITVIDVREPTNPVEVGSYVESGRRFESITLSGNYAYLYERWRCLIAMDISIPLSPSYVGEYDAHWLYRDLDISGSFAGVSRSDGFSLFDVSDPSNPSLLGDYDTPDKVGHGNPIVVSGDYAYMANYRDGLRIMDISDPSNPFVAGICSDFHAGYG